MLIEVECIRVFLWKFGRKLYRCARREALGGVYDDGEYWLLHEVLNQQYDGEFENLIDIGSHVGKSIDSVLSNLKKKNKDKFHIHAIEPSKDSFGFLKEKFKHFNFIKIYNLACSDSTKEQDFYLSGELCGINSLVNNGHKSISKVQVFRLDDFMSINHINRALFVKSDTEGNDFNVLLGGSLSLAKGLIDVWQFEYNHRWISARFFLKDVFDFIKDKPYLIGKLYGNGIEFYEEWHPELEVFFESNYVLVRKGSALENICSKVRFNNSNVLVKNHN